MQNKKMDVFFCSNNRRLIVKIQSVSLRFTSEFTLAMNQRRTVTVSCFQCNTNSREDDKIIRL